MSPLSGSTKTCPDCGEDVPVSARKCRYCQHSFKKKGVASLPPDSWTGKILLSVLTPVVVITVSQPYHQWLHKPLSVTNLTYMRPWDGDVLSPRLHVAGTYPGDCQPTIISSDPEAIRCFPSNHIILDPCWLAESGDPDREGYLAACPDSPWGDSVTLVRTSVRPVQSSKETTPIGTIPWALELENGQRCLLIGGASVTVAGMLLNYQCENGYAAGDPNRTEKVWTALYTKEGDDQVTRQAIREAWA